MYSNQHLDDELHRRRRLMTELRKVIEIKHRDLIMQSCMIFANALEIRLEI